MKSDLLPDAELEFLDLNDHELPIYGIDRERQLGIPQAARSLSERVAAADAVLVSFAEHNGSVTAVWKNAFDWMSRIDKNVWQGKPVVMLAATPGPRAGAGVLGSQEHLAPHFGADVRGTLGIGRWKGAWDAERGALTRSEDVAALDAVLAALDAGLAAGTTH